MSTFNGVVDFLKEPAYFSSAGTRESAVTRVKSMD